MPDLASRKQQLRDRLRFRRRHFAANLDGMARLTAFRAFPAALATRLAKADVVAAYVACGGEPDILPALAAQSPSLALPHQRGRTDDMEFCRWRPGAPLAPGPWGVHQPAGDAESIVPSLILCPLVGFDRHGGRLGQGGGHYDRFFARYPAIPRIGIAWSVQEVDRIPAGPADAPLDAVLTEQEFIQCGDRL